MIDDLAGRVARLERENRRLRRLGALGLLGAAVALLAAAGGDDPAGVYDAIRARKFELLDADGRVRAILQTSTGKHANLLFVQADGTPVFQIAGAGLDETSVLRFYKRESGAHVESLVLDKRELTIKADRDRDAVRIAVDPDGRPTLTVDASR